MRRVLKWWCREKGHKYINGGKGVISILLVVVMLPFVSITDLLVESARYHSAVTILDEAMDSSSLSVLADYDQYLYKRFGLLAVDNTTDISTEYKNYIEKNIESMHSWGVNEISAEGKYALTDNDILTKQIAEFSQYSAPAALVNDMGMSELISTLEKMTKMTDIFEIVSDVGKTTNALLLLAESLEDLKEIAESVESAKSDYDAKYNSFEEAYNQLISSLRVYNQKNENHKIVERKVNEFDKAAEINKQIQTKENELKELEKHKENNEITEEEYEEAKKIIEDELVALKDALEEALKEKEELLQELETAKNELNDAENDVRLKRTALADAKVQYSNSIDTLIGKWGEYQTKADKVLENAESCVTSAFELGTKVAEVDAKQEEKQEDLNKEKQDLAKQKNSTEDKKLQEEYQKSIEEIDNQIEDLKASGNIASASGNAIKDEVTSYANNIQDAMKGYDKGKIQKYVEELQEVQNRLARLNIESISVNDVFSKSQYYVVIEDGFLTSASILILMDSIEKQIVGGNFWNRLDAFGTVLRSLFTTDLFFDSRLISYISEASGYSGGEIDVILSDFITLMNLLDGMNREVTGLEMILFKINAIVDAFKSLTTHIQEYLSGMITRAITAVKEICSNQCGEKILVDEYLIKSLANRTDMGNSGEMGGTDSFTGYKFKNVMFAKHQNQIPILGGIYALKDLYNNIQNGGDDLMFSGAEMEYILVGSRSEAINQATVFFQIYFARFLIDSIQILANQEVKAVATATGTPIGAFVVYLFYLFVEPLVDTILIVNNEDLSLFGKVVYFTPSGVDALVKRISKMGIESSDQEEIKNKAYEICNIQCDPSGLTEDGKGITWKYENYLFLLTLISMDNQTAIERFRNIMTLESKAYYGQEKFKIEKTYTCIEGTVNGKFDPVLPIGGIAVNGLFNQKRNRMRGY